MVDLKQKPSEVNKNNSTKTNWNSFTFRNGAFPDKATLEKFQNLVHIRPKATLAVVPWHFCMTIYVTKYFLIDFRWFIKIFHA